MTFQCARMNVNTDIIIICSNAPSYHLLLFDTFSIWDTCVFSSLFAINQIVLNPITTVTEIGNIVNVSHALITIGKTDRRQTHYFWFPACCFTMIQYMIKTID